MADCVKWIAFKGCALSTSKPALTFAFRPICSACSAVSAKLLRFVFERRNSHHFQLKAIASACRYHHHYCEHLHHNFLHFISLLDEFYFILFFNFAFLSFAFCLCDRRIYFFRLHSREHRFAAFVVGVLLVLGHSPITFENKLWKLWFAFYMEWCSK